MLHLITSLEAGWVTARDRLLDRRDARGNNSIEMAIIVGVVIVVATLIALAIRAAIDARIGGIK